MDTQGRGYGLSVDFAGHHFKNPVTVASGTFGSGMEYSRFVDLNLLGAITTKGVSDKPWEGNPTPRVTETPSGMINAIGLQNPGIDVFMERDLKFLSEYDVPVIVNVCGHSIEEYEAVVERLADDDRVEMLEINVSCPNVKQGAIQFGTDPDMLSEVTARCKARAKDKPVIMKLTPNVTSISEMARAAESGGADGISLINTLTAMKIDIYKRKFALANKTGGLSGPAIHPIAVRMVYEASHAVKIPVIGMGGIATAEDAIEMMMAGATMVAVGMINFSKPDAVRDIITGMEKYLTDTKTSDIWEVIGIL
ncbi:MAG: dihydroorotate dehydrogenase [Lachnospiraceae bacterium]|nr:dihydroorotate dehydrogenase [Lachnospiraceae bacterium]MBR1523747.1 dihydroorotate dehydrogenase [Lachnospiraceae bacterium]